MPLILYGHTFSSYTQKVILALYENATPFEFRGVGPDQPENSAEWLRLWPLRKFPVLVDAGHTVAETSIIIEYLDRLHPGPVRFLPEDETAALAARFLDRFFDLHVPDFRQLSGVACLSLSTARPSSLCPGGGGGAALPQSFPAGGAGSRLTLTGTILRYRGGRGPGRSVSPRPASPAPWCR